MSNFRSKSSQYVESLVSFIVDTKPYHSKLTEVLEEYQFFETMNVKLTEATHSRNLHKAAWMYSYFSGGNPSNRSTRFKRIVSPDIVRNFINSDQANSRGLYKALSDENTDMLGVPSVFSKKRFDGTGVVDAWLEIGGTNIQPYVEGHDFFQSHGANEFTIHQVLQQPGNVYRPLVSETRTNGVIAAATAATQALANDLGNAASANRQLRAFTAGLLSHLQANPSIQPGHAIAVAAAQSLITELDGGTIPKPTTIVSGDLVLTGYYEQIVEGAQAAGVPPPVGYAGWIGENSLGVSYVDEVFATLLPPLLFNEHSDMGLYENASLNYAEVTTGSLAVTNIVVPTSSATYQEWVLTAQTPTTWLITGSSTGILGTIEGGDSFTSALVSFDTAVLGPTTPGTQIFLTPTNQITVHPTAPTEAWDIIKINPRAYTRPAFSSTRYGYLVDQVGTIGQITVLDPFFPDGTIVLTATSATSFTLTSTEDSLYTGVATVGVPYNDGVVAFTIIAGSAFQFEAGDRFYAQIVNGPVTVREFDLYYGYDLDSYDQPDLVYNNTNGLDPDFNRKINFVYDTRFTDYDVASMNLVVTQSALNNRRFRLAAIPDGAAISTLKKDGSGPTNEVDLAEALGGATPPVYNMPGDVNLVADLRLYYSNSFRLEYSDDGFVTTTVVTTVPVGGSFTSAPLGISFTLPAGSKPFVAAIDDVGTEGGDMFAFLIDNPPPTQRPVPAPLLSPRVPRLVMHGDSFYFAPPGRWVVSFSSASAYTVTAYTIFNAVVPGYPVSGTIALPSTIAREGFTYRDEFVHFTIKIGRGLGAGDSFTFNTFDNKPSFLVHGTVSGWAGEAEYGRWFWNGKIGFKVDNPVASVFESVAGVLTNIDKVGSSYPFTVGSVGTPRIRPDCPSLSYTFKKTSNGFMVSRSDRGVIGWVPSVGTFNDEYLRVELDAPDEDFVLRIVADAMEFWNAQDTVIVRSDIEALNPVAGDFVSILKADDSRVGVSIDYESILVPPSLSALQPIGIDTSYIDTYTGPGAPLLSVTSPETEVLNGWIPTYIEKNDSLTSTAHFPDPAARFTLRSAATGQAVARIYPESISLQEPTYLEWDQTFFTQYLPLNTKATIVAYGTGLDDKVRARIAERLNILIGGDALLTNALFNESVDVDLADLVNWFITTEQDEAPFTATLNDASHGGTLAGYDNTFFDNEADPDASYDVGNPLTDHFLQAQQLAGIVPMNARQAALSTEQREAELSGLLGLIGDYLVNGDIAQTTLADWYAAHASATEQFSTTGYGIPARGLTVGGARSADTTASIQEAVVFMMLDSTTAENNTATMMVNSAPPIPDVPVPPVWDDLITPLVVSTPVKTVEVVFQVPPTVAPSFSVWVEGEPAPVSVTATQVTIQKFTIVLPEAAVFKIIVT